MDSLVYQPMVRESPSPRNLAATADEWKSDCCIAPLTRVGDELYACSVCGHLCSDGTLSMP